MTFPVERVAAAPLPLSASGPDAVAIALPHQRLPHAESELHYYWRLFYGRRRLLLAAAILGLSVAAVITFRQPRLYVAQATVEFKQALPPGKDLDIRGIGETIAPALVTRLLTTKVLAARVVNAERAQGHAWLDPPADEETSHSIFGVVWNQVSDAVANAIATIPRAIGTPPGDDRDGAGGPPAWDGVDLAAINRYYSHFAIQPVRGTSLADVVVTHAAPAVAAQLANDHAQAFIEMDVETKVASLQDAQSLLGRQLNDVRAQLEGARKALTDYQLSHGILSLPKNNSTLTRESLKQLNKLLTETQGERIIAEANYRHAAVMSPDDLATTLPDQGLQALRTELLALSARYQANLQDYGANHPDMVTLRARIDSLRAQLRTAALQTRNRLEAGLKAAQAKESDLRTNLATLSRASSAEDHQLIQFSILQRDVESSQELYSNLLQQAKEADLNSGAFRWTNAKLVDRAIAPTAPSYPRTRRNLGLGLLLGLATGCALCLLLERLDNRIHTPDDVVATLGLPSFGVVPDFRRLPALSTYGRPLLSAEKLATTARELVTVVNPASVASEAYRALRTNLMFSSPARPPKTVLVTSTQAAEGKTITVVNLAVSLALSGARVLVIDADVRKPGCHKALQVARRPGLTEVLTGQCELDAALVCSPLLSDGDQSRHNGRGLYVLPAGATPPNPAELLGSEVMSTLLHTVEAQFDFVLIDSAPVLPVTDSVVMATKANAVLYVVKGDEWSRDVIQRALAQLDAVRARTVGVVLNAVDITRGGSTYYYYRHYYSGYYSRAGYGEGASAEETVAS